MSTIAVTGANGFIGRHFCAIAAARGHEVRRIGREVFAQSDPTALQRVDALVHLAARAHQLNERASDPELAFRAANVDLTERIAVLARRAGIRQFVFISSAGVLGRSSPAEGFNDSSPVQPHDAYTRSKLQAEDLLRAQFAGDMDIAIVRPPLVYGPGAPGNFQRLLGAAASGWPLPVGALVAPRSLIGVRNLCDLTIRACADPVSGEVTMLAADAETASVAELVTLVAESFGRGPRLVNLPVGLLRTGLRLAGREADIARLTEPFVLRGTVARERFGWTPAGTLRNELKWALQVASDAGVAQ
jgi:UDP-glucose 4-epimerase